MKSRDFCYWLQGILEVGYNGNGLTADQVEQIQNHLGMVFVHEIDPSFPVAQKPALDKAHSPNSATQTVMRC